MSRTMYDSTTVADIPEGGQLVGVYRNGDWAASEAEVEARFPSGKYVHVWFDVNGTHAKTAEELDVETGDARPEDAPDWIRERHTAEPGALPTIYCNRSTIPAVEAACKAAGLVLARDWWLHVSTLDGTEYTGPGVVACQTDEIKPPAGHYDRSVVYADWWHCLPVPKMTRAQGRAALAKIISGAAELSVLVDQMTD